LPRKGQAGHNVRMNEPVAYLEGEIVPLSQAVLPVWDSGFVLGTTIIEQLRTFGGQVFHLEHHLSRLERSLELVGVKAGLTLQEIGDIAIRLIALNRPLIDRDDDLGLSIFVTPGDSPSMTEGRSGAPRVGIHTFPLSFGIWAEKYSQGQTLITTNTRHVPNECWPAEIKCRSRMNYYLADREASARQTDARALLLDMEGFITEASTANLVIYREGDGLIAPPKASVLPGVSLSVLWKLADQLDIATSERQLLPSDVAQADEVLLSSTPFCILPVSQVDGIDIGQSVPGPIFGRLLAAFDRLVGLDIAAQARRFACRKNAS